MDGVSCISLDGRDLCIDCVEETLCSVLDTDTFVNAIAPREVISNDANLFGFELTMAEREEQYIIQYST